MTKIRMGDRALKVAMLIAGMRDRRVAPLLRPYGFTNADVEEGWERFMRYATAKVGAFPSNSRTPEVLKALTRFETEWFPVTRLTLGHRFPAVADALFESIDRAQGKDVYWKVAFFLERLEGLAKGSEPFGAKGPEAREMLRIRGLTDEEEQGARELIASIVRIEDTSEETSLDELAAAEASMLAWYKEWSGLVRRQVDDRNLLRMLGLIRRKVNSTEESSETEVEIVGEAPAPLGTPVPTAPLPGVVAPSLPASAPGSKANPDAAE